MFKQSSVRISQTFYFTQKRPIFSSFKKIFSKSKTTTIKEQEITTNIQNASQEQTHQSDKANFELKTSTRETSIKEFEMREMERRDSLKESFFPPFSKLEQEHMSTYTNYSLYNQLYSPYRWTPLIQKVKPSLEFHERMYQFRKVRGWEEKDTKELIDTIIFEALRGTDYDYYYDYKCQPSKQCRFHGVVDFLIYKKSGDHLPFVPVFKARKKYNPILNKKIEEFNVCEAVGAANWTLTNSLAINPEFKKTRILQTNGHCWRMYEFDTEGEFKKTGVYTPNGPGSGLYKKIYDDPEMQEIVLGLVRYAAFMHTEGEVGLKKAYDFIDEVKYLEELDEETKSKFEKRRRFWKFLPKSIQDFFFKYK